MDTRASKRFPYWLAAGCCLCFGVSVADAYTPENHALSVRDAAGNLLGRAEPFVVPDVDSITEGVEEPDAFSLGTLEIVHQRVEPGSYGTRREMLPERVASQSIHGSPNPTRAAYGDSEQDQAWLAEAIPLPTEERLEDRYPLDVYAYSTNEQVRNRILINASQFLCVSYAHVNDQRAARSLGWLLHMIGDTYSASHVQRTEPEGGPDGPCGTEQITWHFSMDLISWKQHRPADLEAGDWRYRCLVEHVEDLLVAWVDGRRVVQTAGDAATMRALANEQVAATLGMLCDRVLREDPDVLRRPAGGGAAGFSSASGTDYSEGCGAPGPDRAMQPIGLTGEAEALAWQRSITAALADDGIQFWYPPRDLGDLCAQLRAPEGLPVALQCSDEEIDWAAIGAPEVETMWVPPRAQFR